MNTALASADPAPSPIRCDTAAALPALLAHVLAVVDAGDYFRWWVEHEGIELDLAFTIDKAGAAYRIRRPGGEMAGLFAEFADAIQHGVALYHVVANARRQDGR